MKSVTGNKKLSTRDIILQALKTSNQAKVEALAQAANISPVTVRHHLNALQADGLVEASSVRRKVGRPYYVYNLTEKGHELFPKKYVRFTNRLLDELKSQLPPEQVTDIFVSIVRSIIAEYEEKIKQLNFEERLSFLIKLLAEEGFLADWEKTEQGYRLTEYSCPYISVGADHDEICLVDKELMVGVLQTPVKQHSCMLHGDSCCEFFISTSGIDEIQ